MHDAFLKTLLASPRDDASRQVYADWLGIISRIPIENWGIHSDTSDYRRRSPV